MALTSMKGAMRKVKDLQYSEIEIKVRDATNSDPWGTKRTLMAEIAAATNSYEEYPKLFTMLWKRLTDINHVMHVQKALALVEYLLCNGADRFIRDAKQRSFDIQRLQKYKHYDANGEDDATDTRALAVKVHNLLTDEEKLKEEREKADRMRSLHLGTGISNQTYGTRAHHHHQHKTAQHQQRPHHHNHQQHQQHRQHHQHTSHHTPKKSQHSSRHSNNDHPKALATHGLRADVADRYGLAEPHPADPGHEDDPFGAPPTLGAGAATASSSSAPADAFGAPPAMKKAPAAAKKKKKKSPKKAAAAAAQPAAAADPFGAAPTLSAPSASAQYAAHARSNSKSKVMAAFDPPAAAAERPPMPRQKSEDLISGPMAGLQVTGSEPVVDLFAPEPEAAAPASSGGQDDLLAFASAEAFDLTQEKKSPAKPVVSKGKKTLAERAAADPMSLFDQPSATATATAQNPFGGPAGFVPQQQHGFGAPPQMGGFPQQQGYGMGYPQQPQQQRPAYTDPFASNVAQLPPQNGAAQKPDAFSGLF